RITLACQSTPGVGAGPAAGETPGTSTSRKAAASTARIGVLSFAFRVPSTPARAAKHVHRPTRARLREISRDSPCPGSRSGGSSAPGHVHLDHPAEMGGHAGEADALALPVPDHLALGPDDLFEAGELDLHPHLAVAQARLQQLGDPDSVGRDVLS